MSHGLFKLETFSGDGTQDIESYLKRFDQWQKCTNTNDEQSLAALGWHLSSQARSWFESMDSAPTSLDDLKNKLKNKYKREKIVDMSIFSMKQKSEENINDFLNRLEKEAFRQDLGQNIVVQIVLNGIDKAVGCAISTHGPQTLDDVRRLASRQQTKSTPTVNSVETDLTSALVSKLELMTAALTDLRVEVNMMKKLPRVTHPPAVNNNAGSGQIPRQPPRRPADQPTSPCSRCGGRSCYSIRSCRAMGKICNKCHKPNHFSSVCRSVLNHTNHYQA